MIIKYKDWHAFSAMYKAHNWDEKLVKGAGADVDKNIAVRKSLFQTLFRLM